MVDAKAQEVLANYQKDLERWKERGGHYKDIQPLSINDILLLRAVLHPTDKAESKRVTAEIVKYICEKGVCTARDIYEDLGLSDKPVLKRLKILQQHGMIRRESKKYYLPTPRLYEVCKRYLKRICS